MPKNTIKRFLPDIQTIKRNKALSVFGSVLHDPNLWHLNRKSASGAFGIGLFFALWPVPFQMWLSAALSIPLRVNLPLSIATVWVTNPFTMTPIFYGAYLVGNTILGTPERKFELELSWDWVVASLGTIGPAFLLGCLVCSIMAGLLGYFGLNAIWRFSVIKKWNKRKADRLKRAQAK